MIQDDKKNPSSLNKEGKYTFSVIIPVVNESSKINLTIEHLWELSVNYDFEVIVVDGSADRSTINAVEDSRVLKLSSNLGRALQMNEGFKISRGKILLFLHADTILPFNAFEKMYQAIVSDDFSAGAFDLDIDSSKFVMKLIALFAGIRSRILRVPYGDQAIFIRADYFREIGRYKDIPIMEDVDLMRRIKKRGESICILREKVKTSARRWEKEGILYTTIRNWILVLLFYLGVSPEKLVRFYRRHG